jgi:hypothetical protein
VVGAGRDAEDIADTGPDDDDDDAAGNPPLTRVVGVGPADPDVTPPSAPVTAEQPDTSSSTPTAAPHTVPTHIGSGEPRTDPEDATGPV